MTIVKYEYIKVPGAGSKSKPVQRRTQSNFERVWTTSRMSIDTSSSSDSSYGYENRIEDYSGKSVADTELKEESVARGNNLEDGSYDTGNADDDRRYTDVSTLISSTYNAIIRVALSITNCYANCINSKNAVDKCQSASSSSNEDINSFDERKVDKTSNASNTLKLSEQNETKEMSRSDSEMSNLIRSLIIVEKFMNVVKTDEKINNTTSVQESKDKNEYKDNHDVSKMNVTSTEEDQIVKDECVKKTFDKSITNSTYSNYCKRNNYSKDRCSVSFINGCTKNQKEKPESRTLTTAVSKATNNKGNNVLTHFPSGTESKKSFKNSKYTTGIIFNNGCGGISTFDNRKYYESCYRRDRSVIPCSNASTKVKAQRKLYVNQMKVTPVPFLNEVMAVKETLPFDSPKEYRKTRGSRTINSKKNVSLENKNVPKQNNKYVKTESGDSPSPNSKLAINSTGKTVRTKFESKWRNKIPERNKQQTNQSHIANKKEDVVTSRFFVKKIYLKDKSVQTRTTFDCHLKPNEIRATGKEINKHTEVQEETKCQSKITNKINDRNKRLPEKMFSKITHNDHLELKDFFLRPVNKQTVNSTGCKIADKNFIGNQVNSDEFKTGYLPTKKNNKTISNDIKKSATENVNSKYPKVNTNDRKSNKNVCTIDKYIQRNFNRETIFSFNVSEISPYIEIKLFNSPNFTRFFLSNSGLYKILKTLKDQSNVNLYWRRERRNSAVTNNGKSVVDGLRDESKCLPEGRYAIEKSLVSLQFKKPLIMRQNAQTKDIFVLKTPVIKRNKVSVNRIQRNKNKITSLTYTPVYSVLNRDKQVIELVNSSSDRTIFVFKESNDRSEKKTVTFQGNKSGAVRSTIGGVVRADNVQEVPFKTIDHIVNIVNEIQRNKNNSGQILANACSSRYITKRKTTRHFTTDADKTEAFRLISIEKEISKLLLNPKRKVL